MTESIFGALAPGHGTEMHRQQNNNTETRAQTSLCHTICICYISVMSTVLHPFTPCPQPFPHSQAVWGSVMSCAPHSRLRNDEHTQRHVISSKPSRNATFSSCSPWRQSSNTLEILSHAPSVSCKTLTSVFISLISISMLLSKRYDFLLIDEITRACRPRGSRFGRLPLATNSCSSGRKPGLDLQREIIERVFIHDQSFIQKVLGHLDREHKRGEIL